MDTGTRQGCALATPLFSTFLDWLLDRAVDQWVTDLAFPYDAVMLANSMEVLMLALKTLHEEAEPSGLKVYLVKVKE